MSILKDAVVEVQTKVAMGRELVAAVRQGRAALSLMYGCKFSYWFTLCVLVETGFRDVCISLRVKRQRLVDAAGTGKDLN